MYFLKTVPKKFVFDLYTKRTCELYQNDSHKLCLYRQMCNNILFLCTTGIHKLVQCEATSPSCDDGWLHYGNACYLINNIKSVSRLAADAECKYYDSSLLEIKSSDVLVSWLLFAATFILLIPDPITYLTCFITSHILTLICVVLSLTSTIKGYRYLHFVISLISCIFCKYALSSFLNIKYIYC